MKSFFLLLYFLVCAALLAGLCLVSGRDNPAVWVLRGIVSAGALCAAVLWLDARAEYRARQQMRRRESAWKQAHERDRGMRKI